MDCNTAINALVIMDLAGGYYLVDPETLEDGRVPEEMEAELERQMRHYDTTGFFATAERPAPFVIVGQVERLPAVQGSLQGGVVRGLNFSKDGAPRGFSWG